MFEKSGLNDPWINPAFLLFNLPNLKWIADMGTACLESAVDEFFYTRRAVIFRDYLVVLKTDFPAVPAAPEYMITMQMSDQRSS